MTNMKQRSYVQSRRAEAAAATGTRILEAAITLFLEGGAEPTLDAVASRSGVTVQTVLRRFGSKEQLFHAAVEHGRAHVADTRGAAPVGDIAGAVSNLIEHYAEWGDRSLRLLALEGSVGAAAEATRTGRAFHHAWVARVFAPQLAKIKRAERPRRLAALIATTDVYVWKILHHDLGLPRDEVEAILRNLVSRILA